LKNGNFDASDLDINNIIEKVLSSCQNEVKRYKDGEEKLLGFFIGQINKQTRGKVNHELIIAELKKKLKN
jgi:aspartyl-tRNA(Asn)/glutamyl-tRNA(Gln) amidotransferase subunit B